MSAQEPDRAGADRPRCCLQQLDAELPPPAYAHPGDAGADLVTRVDVDARPGGAGDRADRRAIALPQGYAAFVHPRSGLAARHGVTDAERAGHRGRRLPWRDPRDLVNTDRTTRWYAAPRRPDRPARRPAGRARRFRPRRRSCPDSARGAGGHGSTGGFAGHQAPARNNIGADAPEGDIS